MTLADGSEAYALTQLCGPISAGDELLVNTTALDLGLGTGGAHVVHTNLTAPWAGSGSAGRAMKARYLAEQLAVDAVEELPGRHSGVGAPGSLSLAGQAERSEALRAVDDLPSLQGVRVVLCVLHSHALALAATASDTAASRVLDAGASTPDGASGEAPGYVMTDGGALPFVLSDLAAACLERGVIATAASTGQAFGAPIEAVTVASGVAALAQRGVGRIIVSPGPGHLGTASALGFSALDLAGHAAVLDGLGAATALAVRASSADERGRHRGVSHHTRALAELTPPRTVVPTPNRCGAVDAAWAQSLGQRAIEFEPAAVAPALSRFGLEVNSMGRPLAEDDDACAWLGAAAAWLVSPS